MVESLSLGAFKTGRGTQCHSGVRSWVESIISEVCPNLTDTSMSYKHAQCAGPGAPSAPAPRRGPQRLPAPPRGRGRAQRRAQRHVTGGKPRGAGRGRSGHAPRRRGRGVRPRRRSARSGRPGCGKPEAPGGAAAMGLFGKTPEKPPKELVRGRSRRAGPGGGGAGSLRREWRQGRVALLWRRAGTAEGPGLAWPWRRLHPGRDRALRPHRTSRYLKGLQGAGQGRFVRKRSDGTRG